MDLLQLMEERYSLRAYDARPVEEEKLQRVLEAGRIAPTAKNMQPWKVYVVEKEKDLALLRSLTPCAFDAPVVLMFCGIEAESAHSGFDGHSWDQMDTTIVMTHMMLEAQAQGLGTCIVAGSTARPCRRPSSFRKESISGACCPWAIRRRMPNPVPSMTGARRCRSW